MSGTSITFLVGLCLLIVFTFYMYKKDQNVNREKKDIILDMSVDAMFIALILIMNFVPNLGFISVGTFISFTLMHLPVLLGAVSGGVRRGVILGFAFGIASWIQAMQGVTGLNVYFIYPWISVLPRVLFGFLAGLTFSFIGKVGKGKTKGLYLLLASAGLTIIHTLLVFACLLIFFNAEVGALLASTNPVASTTKLTFLALILIGAGGEAGIAAILIPTLSTVLAKAVPNVFGTKVKKA